MKDIIGDKIRVECEAYSKGSEVNQLDDVLALNPVQREIVEVFARLSFLSGAEVALEAATKHLKEKLEK